MANTFVWERGFAWRQSSLRIIQLQSLGVAAYSLSLAFAGVRAYGLVALLSTSAWSLLHSWVRTRDMRRYRESRNANAVLTGLHAIGGFGGLPAPYAWALLTAAIPVDGPEDLDLRRRGDDWAERHLGNKDIREMFLLLADEFAGTADELLGTCEALTNT